MADLIKRINDSELNIKIKKRKPVGMSEDYASRVEENVFTAYYNQNEVGHISVDRIVKPTKEESGNPFFSDLDFDLPRSRPWLFFMGTEDEYKGNRIAGALIKFANEFYKSTYGTPLHSGTSNIDDAIKVWERLVNHGEAVEYTYDNKRRWKML